MSSSSEIPRILRDEIETARTTYESAYAGWHALAYARPSSLLSPDDEQKISNASQAYRAALRAYEDVLKESTDFIRDGTIPGRLKDL